jgi:chromosome partitioning protein
MWGEKMTVYAIVNQKGGVGKTTTAINLGAALREIGNRVLVIDLDPQGNATLHCGFNPDKQSETIWSAFSASLRMDGMGVASRKDADLIDFDIDLELGSESRPSLEECIISAGEDGFDLVPSNLELSQADADLMSAINRERRLDRLIEPIRDRYDFILLDCPPYLGLLTINALAAADYVIVPLQAAYLAMKGVNTLFRTIALVQRDLNYGLRVRGVLLTMVDQRTIHSRQVVDVARSTIGRKIPVFETEIPQNVDLADATAAGKSVLLYAPRSRGALAYRKLAEELTNA